MLGRVRERQAGGGVGAEEGDDVFGLRAAEEFFEAGREFEALFEGVGAVEASPRTEPNALKREEGHLSIRELRGQT
ncbi:MAG TPA: hypothetical protein VFK50_04175, partial [Sphingomicrobium sp.]|nr:hypothetical protein [Sphingomicrobium sp.]